MSLGGEEVVLAWIPCFLPFSLPVGVIARCLLSTFFNAHFSSLLHQSALGAKPLMSVLLFVQFHWWWEWLNSLCFFGESSLCIHVSFIQLFSTHDVWALHLSHALSFVRNDRSHFFCVNLNGSLRNFYFVLKRCHVWMVPPSYKRLPFNCCHVFSNTCNESGGMYKVVPSPEL